MSLPTDLHAGLCKKLYGVSGDATVWMRKSERNEMNAPAQPQLTREATAQIWRDFCAKLADAGDVLLRTEVPDNALHQAEGLRYLTHLLRSGLLQNLEMTDPDFPVFFSPYLPWSCSHSGIIIPALFRAP